MNWDIQYLGHEGMMIGSLPSIRWRIPFSFKVGLSPIFKFEGLLKTMGSCLGVSVMRTNYSRSTKIRTSCETSGAVVADGS